MKTDYQTRLFWSEVVKDGVMGLTRQNWACLDYKLDEPAKQIFQMFLDGLERQSKWIDERTAAMRDEAERIALIGETMRRAGLRSYTDEKGCVFVAGRGKP